MTMRIALDTNACHTSRAGCCRYVQGLQSGFSAMAGQGPEVIPLSWPVDNLSYSQPLRSIKTFYRDILWKNLVAPVRLKQIQADLYHDTVSSPAVCPSGMPRISTFHDASVFVYPNRFRRWHRFWTPYRLHQTVMAKRLIAISRFSADEAIRWLAVDAGKMDVIHLGSSFADPTNPMAEIAPSTPPPAEFCLFVGSLEPVKNLALLRTAWLSAHTSGQSLPPLLIVGSRWKDVEHEGPPPPDWHYLGPLPDGMLLYLMKRAIALVFPSKYEGFGLPVLEAMSVGCPVICSRVASLPEVGGEAPFYAELNPTSYLTAIREVSSDSTLRQELIKNGLKQAMSFSWKQCAEQTAEAYRKCAPNA